MMYAKHLLDAGTSYLGIFARNNWKCPIKTRTRMYIIRGADLKEDRRRTKVFKRRRNLFKS